MRRSCSADQRSPAPDQGFGVCCPRNLMTGEGFEVGLEPDDEQQHCDTEITERPDEVEIGNSGHAQHEARCEEVDERWEAQQRGRETEDDNGEQLDGRGHGSLSYQSYVEPHRRLPTGIGRYSALTREREGEELPASRSGTSRSHQPAGAGRRTMRGLASGTEHRGPDQWARFGVRRPRPPCAALHLSGPPLHHRLPCPGRRSSRRFAQRRSPRSLRSSHRPAPRRSLRRNPLR